jgi:Ca-activated chloride channel family protein
MKINANDPRWTAYALGELTDEGEIAEMESILAESSEMRQLVEEIRQTAGMLKEEFQAEPPLHLTQAQRETIEEKSKPGVSWFGLKPAWAMASAAAVLVMISFVTFWELGKEPPLERTQTAALVEEKSVASLEADSEGLVEAERRDASASRVLSGASEKSKTAKRSELQPQRAAGVLDEVKPEEEFKEKDAAAIIAATEAPASSNEPADKASISVKTGLPSAKAVSPSTASTRASDTLLNSSSIVTGGEAGDAAAMPPDSNSAAGLTDAGARAVQVLGALSSSYTPAENQPKYAEFAEQEISAHGRRYPMPRPRPRGDERFPMPRQKDRFNTESYDHISDNPFLNVTENPLSTFSIDVDTASYSNVRRFLDGGSLPPKDSVRIEELVNYFDYDYRGPKDNKPFAVNFEITEAPWNSEHRLLRIGLKGREIESGERPDSNLVFLIDVSGSMRADNKLPLVKQSLRLLVGRLKESDRVAIVVYSGNTRLVLPSTGGDQKGKLLRAIDSLHAGGSTNGASGIQLAYKTAQSEFTEGGVNRVILATDGDFNVGMTSRGDLTRLIEEKAETGIYLSALGFGMGNYKDSTLELLADKGRGNYAYIDTINEAKKVLVEQTNATLVPIAKDVKIQVEFNPKNVGAYRLIGYEDRIMPKEDFNDDAKQAGVIGAGHTVTALYELVPAGKSGEKPGVDPLKYQKALEPSSFADSDELLTVKIRSKEPEKDVSVLSEFAFKESEKSFKDASEDFKFAAAVAAFGMVLRDSPHKGSADLEDALEWAKEGKANDIYGYRHEFIRLIHRAISIHY